MRNPKLRIFTIIAAIILLLVFYIFSRAIRQDFLKQTDFNVTVKLQERIDKSSRLRLAEVIGNVFEGSTFFASPEVSVVVVGLLTLTMLYDRKDRKWRWQAICIPLFFGLLVLGEIYGKSVVHHPAPPFFMIKNPTTIFPKYYVNEQYSYPSGHAARAVFMSIVFYSLFTIHDSLFKRRKLRLGLMVGIICYVLLVSTSRIYLGHHWLSDVLGGIILGSSFGLLTLGVNSHIIDEHE